MLPLRPLMPLRLMEYLEILWPTFSELCFFLGHQESFARFYDRSWGSGFRKYAEVCPAGCHYFLFSLQLVLIVFLANSSAMQTRIVLLVLHQGYYTAPGRCPKARHMYTRLSTRILKAAMEQMINEGLHLNPSFPQRATRSVCKSLNSNTPAHRCPADFLRRRCETQSNVLIQNAAM